MTRTKAARQAALAASTPAPEVFHVEQPAPQEEAPQTEPRVLEDLRQEEDGEGPAPDLDFDPEDAEIDADIDRPKSVVGRKYKLKYKAMAKDRGLKGKEKKRSIWDWLAQTIAGECLDGNKKLKVDEFRALLDANGVDHSRWQNKSPGWEGRLRMTGRLALERVIAEAAVLKLADGEELEVPEADVARFRAKFDI